MHLCPKRGREKEFGNLSDVSEELSLCAIWARAGYTNERRTVNDKGEDITMHIK